MKWNFMLLSLLTLGFASAANAQVVLPTTGVDIAAHITAAIVAFGPVFAVAIGGMFAFKIVKKGARLISSALGG